LGPVGAGHFTKMVHNGIEYGMMQAYAEGFAVLHASDLGIDAMKAVKSWQEGSVVRSWLLDLLVLALEQSPDFEGIRGVAADSGEGRWTVAEAIRLGVATLVITVRQTKAATVRFSLRMRGSFHFGQSLGRQVDLPNGPGPAAAPRRAATPASISPSCGPPAKNSMPTAVMRPRISSGVVS